MASTKDQFLLAVERAILDEQRSYAQDFDPDKPMHFDRGKPRVDLLPVDALIAISQVFGYGAQKYSDRNWEKGVPQTKLYASTLRHLFAWMQGEDIDPESLHPHLAHAGCDILMMLALQLRERADDREGL